MTIGIDVSANVQSTVGGVRQVTRALEELRAEVQRVNGDLSKLSDADRTIWEGLERNVKQGLQTPAGAAARRRIEGQTGSADPSLQAILNTPLHIDPREDARLKRNILTSLGGGGIGIQVHNQNVPGQPPPGSSTAATIAGAITGGGTIGGTLGSAAGGGIGGVIGGILGGPLGAAAGAIRGSSMGARAGAAAQAEIGSNIESVRDRAIGLEDFRNSLALSARSFSTLNETVKKAADGLGITNAESQRLTRNFSELASVSDPNKSAAGMRSGVGLARAFGIDAAQGVNTTASLSYKSGLNPNEVTGIVAESIIRSGMVQRAGEVMEALNRAVAESVQRSLVSPDLNALGAMTVEANQTGIKGLSGAGGVNAIMGASNDIAQGGARGEASRLFINAAFKEAYAGSDIATDPFALDLFMKTGGLTTPAQVGKELGIAGFGDSKVTGLEAVTRYFNQMYPEGSMSPSQRANAFSGLVGGAVPAAGQGLLRTLSATGDPSDLFGAINRASEATGADLMGLKSSGYSRLIELDKRGLDPRSQEYKAEVERIQSSDRETTVGADVRQNRADVANASEQLAAEFLPLAEAAREAKTALLDLANLGFRAGGSLQPAPVGSFGRAKAG